MVIKGTFSFPLKSAEKFAKCFVEIPPLPEYITAKGPFTRRDSGKGTKIITLYEFNESRFAEASHYIFKQLEAFRGVPGLTFSTQVWGKAEQALESIAFKEKT